MNERLVVLDTNVVFDLFHFDDALTRPLRTALETGHLRAAASIACLEEWRRVLAYPGFALDAAAQGVRFERYRALCSVFDAPAPPDVPRCADPDDQKFLELAAALRVPLISKDRAVLKLRRRCAAHFPVLTPAEALAWL